MGGKKHKSFYEHVVIPLEVEHGFTQILGDASTHGLVGIRTLTRWRQLGRRLVSSLEKFLDTNVETDSLHQEQLSVQIRLMREALDEKVGREREPRLVMALVKICLLLMGSEPEHFFRRVVNRPEHYLLNEYRTVCFTQTGRQKVNLILLAHRNRRIPGLVSTARLTYVGRREKWVPGSFSSGSVTNFPGYIQSYFRCYPSACTPVSTGLGSSIRSWSSRVVPVVSKI